MSRVQLVLSARDIGVIEEALQDSVASAPLRLALAMVFGALVAAVTLFLLWRLCRAGHTGESMLLFAMLCYLLMENKMFLFSANPLILLLPCALLTPWGAPLPTLCPKPDVRTKDPATV